MEQQQQITMIPLNNGRLVEKQFLDLIRDTVMNRLPHLSRYRYKKATLQTVCGDGFWKQLKDGERRTAGMCMVHLVEQHMVPLFFAESDHEYPKYYHLK